MHVCCALDEVPQGGRSDESVDTGRTHDVASPPDLLTCGLSGYKIRSQQAYFGGLTYRHAFVR